MTNRQRAITDFEDGWENTSARIVRLERELGKLAWLAIELYGSRKRVLPHDTTFDKAIKQAFKVHGIREL